MESKLDYKERIKELDFSKTGGLIPAIVQDKRTNQVLMLGYMNEEAYQKTCDTGYVTFYSRSRKELWTKGETSGNYLRVEEMAADCDQDTLLVKVVPAGNTCHLGNYSCFAEPRENPRFLLQLEELLYNRKRLMPEGSYTAKLFSKGMNKIAQKVGEEAVELVIEAKDNNQELFVNEAADLIYHMLVMIVEKGLTLQDVILELERRHQ
jgi:phosphoribosyl-ATP pyrophosphohydrolase/phosphoribosyl-AMP cyclohydrolase